MHAGGDHELGQLGSKLVKARAKRANLKAYGITAPFWAEIFCFVFFGLEVGSRGGGGGEGGYVHY